VYMHLTNTGKAQAAFKQALASAKSGRDRQQAEQWLAYVNAQ